MNDAQSNISFSGITEPWIHLVQVLSTQIIFQNNYKKDPFNPIPNCQQTFTLTMLVNNTKSLAVFALVTGSFTVVQANNDWRTVLEGVDGYPAGNMLEIALRRTNQDHKLEMFQWRSEFIAMLGVQPGSEVEREWKTLSSWPPMTGDGTWTGMTWWENQQSWHDMANIIFPSPVTSNWLTTINMTLCHVRPDDVSFNLRTLAQSGTQVLELGILAYAVANAAAFDSALSLYLDGLNANGANQTGTFEFFSNGAIYGPLTVAYNANGAPALDGSEEWKVYMAVWDSIQDYDHYDQAAASVSVQDLLNTLKNITVQEHSSIDIVTRSTSKVCCKSDQCVLDPEQCNVGVLGMQDTWAANCAQCPSPCLTDHNVCSLLSSKTCLDIGGSVQTTCETPQTSSSARFSSYSLLTNVAVTTVAAFVVCIVMT